MTDGIDPTTYHEVIEEAFEPWSYMSFPYIASLGKEEGRYRVGPLARLAICSRTGSPKSDGELQQFREFAAEHGGTQDAILMHYARLVEMLFALERIEELLADPDVLRDDTLRSRAFSNSPRGIGCSEAPRGTLFHDYSAGSDGVVRSVRLLIATAQNNLAMNSDLRDIAQRLFPAPGAAVDDRALNLLESGIRAYDPCFSCATHALGHMPLRVSFRRSDGSVIREIERGTS